MLGQPHVHAEGLLPPAVAQINPARQVNNSIPRPDHRAEERFIIQLTDRHAAVRARQLRSGGMAQQGNHLILRALRIQQTHQIVADVPRCAGDDPSSHSLTENW